MRKIILRISKFTLIYCLFLFVIAMLVERKSSFKVEKDIHSLFIGHSHSACAYNDSLISGFSNFSSEGESYFYAYYKIKKIIEQNKQVKRIFIEFSNNQINEEMNDWIWGDKYMSHRFPKYGLFMDMDAYYLLVKENPICLLNSIIPLLKNNFSIILNSFEYTKENGLGGYKHLDREKVDSILSIKKTLKNIKPRNTSLKNIEYLSKIIQLLQQNNLEIYLVRSPMHMQNIEMQNEIIFNEILTSNFSETEFLDFSKFPIQNSEFGDLSHLNYKGAKKFSNWFNDLIDDNLLSKVDKQKYIDQKIEYLQKND